MVPNDINIKIKHTTGIDKSPSTPRFGRRDFTYEKMHTPPVHSIPDSRHWVLLPNIGLEPTPVWIFYDIVNIRAGPFLFLSSVCYPQKSKFGCTK